MDGTEFGIRDVRTDGTLLNIREGVTVGTFVGATDGSIKTTTGVTIILSEGKAKGDN